MSKSFENRCVLVMGTAGLGNRMRTVVSALDYCRRTNRKLYVDWSDGMYGPKGENIFANYFKIDDVLWIRERPDFAGTVYPEAYDFDLKDINEEYPYRLCEKYKFNPVKNFIWTALFAYLPPSWSHYLVPNNVHHSVTGKGDLIRGGFIKYSRNEDNVVYLDFNPRFKKSLLAHSLMLTEDMDSKIRKYMKVNDLDDSTIGIHIRATDIVPDKGYSAILKRLDELINSGKYKNVYLATDNVELVGMFREHFGDKLKYNDDGSMPAIEGKGGSHHWSKRNADDSQKIKMFENAILDMYVLSRVGYLFYQGNSSFSINSAIIRSGKRSKDWMKVK